MGIPPGPIYKQIKENETYTLPNGEVIFRKDFLGPTKHGRIISILGDTKSTEKNQKFVQGSDVLVHEATFNKENKELAEKYYHSTTEQAALLAKNSAVRKLILTHISSRYQSIDYPILLEEAKDIFHNTILAEDFF